MYDANGQQTGQVLSKDEVHAKGLWHASVHLWVVTSDGKILLQYRAADKNVFPSCWDTSVAGHVSNGGSLKETAVRETEEEIGLTISENELETLGYLSEEPDWLPGGKHREHNTIFVVVKDFKLENLKVQQEELTDLKLVTADELEEMLSDTAKRKELSGHDDKLFELAIEYARRKSN